MTRWLYVLLVVLMLLPACSFLNDFDGYRFEADAAIEGRDPRKPPRRDAGELDDAGERDGETEPPPSREDAAQPADARADVGTVGPAPDAAQGAPDGGKGDSGGSPFPGLEGAWLVRLPLTSSSCSPPPAPVELGSWEVRVVAAGAVLQTAAFALEGSVQREGERLVAASFGGDIDGAHVTVELELEPDGALGGVYILELDRGCIHYRAVEGVR